MKNSTFYRLVFLSFMLLTLKCAAAEEEEDETISELFIDLTVGIMGVAFGICSENIECSTSVLPIIIIIAFIVCLCGCLFPGEDDYHNRRFRYRTAGSGYIGYRAGRMIAKNW